MTADPTRFQAVPRRTHRRQAPLQVPHASIFFNLDDNSFSDSTLDFPNLITYGARGTKSLSRTRLLGKIAKIER